MGDVTIANDILDALSEAFQLDVGKALTLREVSLGSLNPINPGAGRTPTNIDHSAYGIISSYDSKRIDGTLVLKGDMEGILSLKELSVVPEVGMRVIDGAVDYEIIRAEIPEVAGVGVVAILQLRK